MEIGYFAAAWGDIKNSPGWFSKLIKLALISLIPVFGWIVVYGYLYGWARDIAWNVHRPLPEKIFGNEDGKLYSRGFFIMIVVFIFSLVPTFISYIPSLITTAGSASVYDSAGIGAAMVSVGVLSILTSLVTLVLMLAVLFFIWVGSMRVSLYGTLSSGFQLGKIWSMIRYDFSGLLRIMGMYCIFVVVTVVGVCLIAFMVTLAIAIGVGAGIAGGYSSDTGFVAAVAIAAVICIVVLGLVILVVDILAMALAARALGYWTCQFDVAHWGGQDDLMPFERAAQQGSQQNPPTSL